MTARKVRTLLGAVGVAAAIMATAVPAAAAPPTHQQFTFSGAVTDQGQACGDPLSWEFTGDATVTRFFDGEGTLVRISVLVQESGTVTNLATGEVVELPRTAFTERVLFVEDGSIIIEDVGLSVRVTGPEDFLLDVGRFVVRLDPDELLQSSGQHPIREINPFSVSDPALLGAFCDLFD
ncbi:MAG TPA: hypothetical protein VE737_00920 [Actinomycetota bacterium]|nr:hypothetical protein [Actinomycetota bacterium]